MIFDDRRHAGVLLAKELDVYRRHAGALVLALPRGGVVVGFEVALALHLALDVFITRKVGLPESPEYAIGAVSETGSVYLNPEAAGSLNEAREDVDGLIEAQRHEISRRQILYRHGRTLPMMQDHTVILIDDGIATGSTFFATIEAIRKLSPGRLVAAIPVSPSSTAHKVRALVDHCVILATPEPFGAVGEFYTDFQQITDDEVLRCLGRGEQANHERPHTVGSSPPRISAHHQSEM
ncbi:MAG: phosphoribosyltransferase [Nitrospiraceae bacterium]|nr:phosphoribosyltransferase [Nitrospiraceae bacterium]